MVGSGSRGVSGRFTPSWDDARYVLGERLGEGAAGVVHRAVEVATRRVVAVKWLCAGVSDPQRAQRFAREGQALANLSHPGILVQARQLLERAATRDELRDAARALLARLP